MLPMNSFMAFYTILCSQLRQCLRHITKHMTVAPDPDYEKIIGEYVFIRTFASEIENELSVFVFTASLYNACTMYFGMAVITRSAEFIDTIHIFAVWCVFIASSVAYMGLALSGSLVHEAATDLWLKAHEMLSRKQEVNRIQQRFLSIVEKKLHFTVWKILPITRSFILGTIGTVFSYYLLFYNIASPQGVTNLGNMSAM
ncbi:hypothetical protein AVEN_213995-1 [Araneus ventricosus]|uniref:Gustatory receptor n=2 Tax=Araneus ventricosus TaxID=182803 RepID=A0A4Y2QJU0_ARAVE|nr:hypothetical protein AVEN_213995-1 [Araneus ventricosus]